MSHRTAPPTIEGLFITCHTFGRLFVQDFTQCEDHLCKPTFLPAMASVLFKAQLIDDTGKQRSQVARILFGVESLEEKEKTFRLICQKKYPQLRIQEPLSITPAPMQ